MRTNLIFTFQLVWLFLFLAGCSADNETQESGLPAVKLTAGYATTRTAMDATYNVLWKSGDVINVNGQPSLRTTVSAAGRVASFDVEATPAYYAFYPASMVSSFDNTAHVFTITLPDTQVYKNDASFSDNTNAAVAVSDNTYLSFYNVCGTLRIPITTNAGAVKARLQSADNAVSGEATVNPDTKTLTVTGTGKTVDITLLPNASTYALTWVLPAATYGPGWKIQLMDGNGNVLSQKTFSSSLVIKRAFLANVTATLNFPKDETPTAGEESEVIYDYVDGGSEWASGDIGF